MGGLQLGIFFPHAGALLAFLQREERHDLGFSLALKRATFAILDQARILA